MTTSWCAEGCATSSGEDDITVVGEAGTAEDALELIPQTTPDVAVLDVRLGDRAGDERHRGVPADPF